MNHYKIAAVIVTYNRLTLLKECIEAVRNQTRKLDEIIVINNSSTDGTSEWLEEQNDLTVITQENSGSAGGQYTGIKTAYEKGYDWIWCLDADVVADVSALENLLEADELKLSSLGFLSSTVVYTDKSIAYANIPELGKPFEVIAAFISGNSLPIISASFGSLLLPRKIIEKVGLPCHEFFIWGDDAEYTLRIISNGYNGFQVKKSIATHKSETNPIKPFLNLSKSDLKFKFGIRNMVYVIIFRNKIVYNSSMRGYFSSMAFVLRIFKDQMRKEKFRFSIFIQFFFQYLKGLYFKPKINFPEQLK